MKKYFAMGRRLLSLTMALVVLLLAVPALASTNPDAVTTTFTFQKELTLEDDANVPNATFTFTITPEEAEVTPTGTPTVGTAVFVPGDTTTDQTGDQKTATKPVNVDFSPVTFNAPGIYSYTITENASTVSGITNDTATTRTLDVHVSYADATGSKLNIMGYTLYNGNEKSGGFQNSYATSNLTLKKAVTGNQGDRNKEFAFTVTISNATAGNTFPMVKGNVTEPLTTATDGTVTKQITLKNGESVTIYGLAPDNTFAITEDDYTGYTTTYQVGEETVQTGRTLAATAIGDADKSVTFTNDKQGTVPTGILMDVQPYLILATVVLAAFALLLVFGKKRRAR